MKKEFQLIFNEQELDILIDMVKKEYNSNLNYIQLCHEAEEHSGEYIWKEHNTQLLLILGKLTAQVR